MLLINSKHNANVLLIDSKHSGNVLLINKKLAKLENDAECASSPKFTELVKKPSNRTKTGTKKPYGSISHFWARFVEPVRRSYFCFIESLAGLTDGLAMGKAKSRKGKIAISFCK